MLAISEEARDVSAQLRLWQQAGERRALVLAELADRLALQAERDVRLIAKLESARARLDRRSSGAGGHVAD
jgi:hypothetical protein